MATPRELPPNVQMPENGPVLYREWVWGPMGTRWRAGAAIFGTISLLAVAGMWWEGYVLWAAATFVCVTLTLLTLVWFRGLSIVVDERGIEWSFGPLFRKRYTLDEVQMFRSREFAFRKRGGWGIGRADDGLDRYEVWGANGTALDLVVRRADVTRHYLVSTVAPELVCAALVRANARPRR